MSDEKQDEVHVGQQDRDQQKFFRVASHKRYSRPEPILDPTCVMEQEERGDGMAVDDEKTYHRTEK